MCLTGKMEYRKIKIEDLEPLIIIKKKVEELNDFAPDYEIYYRSLIKNGIGIVAKEGDKIIGYIIGENEEEFNHSYIEDAWVKEEYRYHGLGKKMLEMYETECKRKKITFLSAYVVEDNVDLKAIERRGFRKRKKYFFIEKEIK
jgi:ribosomal protein S18 acetylase RimI-like enzyme